MENNVKEGMWVALVLNTGQRAIGRTYICPIENKIAVRYLGDYIDAIAYLEEIEAITEITIDWEETQ